MKELIDLQYAIQRVSKIENIKKHTREKHHVLARALFSMVAYEDFKISKIEISRFLGFNHATILHLIKGVNETYKTGYEVFNVWHVNLEKFYRDVYFRDLSENLLVDKLERVKQEVEKNTKLTQQNEELRKLMEETKEMSGDLSDFLAIPKERMQEFKDTRLVPYLKMLGIN
jgi:predicted transcriptional regulator